MAPTLVHGMDYCPQIGLLVRKSDLGLPLLISRLSCQTFLEEPFFLEDDGLDELSNSVLDLVRTGRFDEALAACTRLLEEFPDVVDGFERSGLVHAKMGNHTLAADFYRKALDFVTHPSRRDDYEDVDFYREQVENEERLAGLRRT